MIQKNRRKKICILCQAAYPLLVNSHDLSPADGAELQLVTLGRQFAKREYRVNFLVDDFKQPSSIILDDGLLVNKMPLRYMGRSNYYFVPDWISLFLTISKVAANIYIIRLPNHLLFPFGIYCKLFRRKLVFICQTAWDAAPDYLKLNRNFLEYCFYRVGLWFTDHIVAQSHEQRDAIKQFCTKEISVIKNVLSFDHVEIAQKKGFILWVGSNYSVKRPELFLHIAKKCPQFQFKMIMNITKQQPDDKYIRKQCQGISNLEYIGSVPFHEIKPFFETAEIFVSTSATEGFPNVFLQAWQCGVPVVSIDVDPDGIIRKRDLGRVSLSVEQMITDIEELMTHHEIWTRLGENSIKYVQQYHNLDRILDQYCNLFDKLI